MQEDDKILMSYQQPMMNKAEERGTNWTDAKFEMGEVELVRLSRNMTVPSALE